MDRLKVQSSTPHQNIVRDALIEHYSSQNVDNLVNSVVSDKPFYTEALIDVKLTDSVASSVCKVSYEMSFASNIDRFVLGFAPNSTIEDKILTFCPSVNEIFTIPDKGQRSIEISKILKGDHQFRILKGHSGSTMEEKMVFTEIEDSESKKVIGSFIGPAEDRVRIFAFKPDHKPICFIVSIEYVIRKDAHFYHWVADRPIYVKQLNIDASQLTIKDRQRISFHPFFANTSTCKDNYPDQGVFSAKIDNWLIKGQGIAVSWGPI